LKHSNFHLYSYHIMTESPEGSERNEQEIAESIGLFIVLAELSIRKQLRLLTCLSNDNHSFRLMEKPILPHTEIDAIIDTCKNSFGTDRSEMKAVIEHVVGSKEAYEARHEAYRSEAAVKTSLKELGKIVWTTLFGDKTTQTGVSDRETVSQIAVYTTLETLVRTADLEAYEPDRVAAMSDESAKSGKVGRLLAQKL